MVKKASFIVVHIHKKIYVGDFRKQRSKVSKLLKKKKHHKIYVTE